MIYCIKYNSSKRSDLKILVTNDDGINATGLWVLAERLKQVGRLFHSAGIVVVLESKEDSRFIKSC